MVTLRGSINEKGSGDRYIGGKRASNPVYNHILSLNHYHIIVGYLPRTFAEDLYESSVHCKSFRVDIECASQCHAYLSPPMGYLS